MKKETLKFFFLKKMLRNDRTAEHATTPNIYQVCSKRSWDGQMRKWRRYLHQWDPQAEEDEIVINPEEEEEEWKDDEGNVENIENENNNCKILTIYDDYEGDHNT